MSQVPPPANDGVSPTEPWDARVRVLLDRAVDLTGEHDRDAVLQQIVESAAAVADARYAALGVYDDDGTITTFVHHGLDAATVERIGELPHGRGMLGQVIVADEPIRLDDLGADPRSCGFPPNHPPMRTFLGAPIARRGRRYGNLYLTEKQGGGPFDDEDEALVMALAAFATGAIESAELLAAERARTDAVAGQVAAEERARARREILAAVIAAQEAERARVSRDLHDDIGQALTSVMLGLRLLDDGSDAAPAADSADARQRIDELRELVADALRRTRRLAFDLRPTVLDDIGLVPALERLVADVAERSALAVDVAVDGIAGHDGIAPEVATVVYRVVQEALTNVVRHAGAASASVAVTVSSGRLRAVIEDNGAGFDPGVRADGHLGLEGMRERAGLVGGTVRVLSEKGSGATVVLEVPIV
ncbi:MAG TPA: GAF domain-containing sensor histidine kinase [Acidimicrobiales bacterium]|nr:GAF domain-containing sensor histidine kinase [Acidimicrobiales bacterium]